MSAKLLPPKTADFVRDMWRSATHRRMFFIAQTLTKVSALFQLLPDDEVPDEATAAFFLILEGLESGNPIEYARCDALAMQLYREWLATREVH